MDYTTRRYIASDIELLQKAAATASGFARQIQDGIAAARVFRDPDLTDAAQTARREDLERNVREAGKAQVSEYRASIQRAREYLTAQAKEHTKLPEDPAALMLAMQRWQGVERMLDAGHDLRDVIARTDDVSTLLAIKEFAPAYEAAKGYRPATPQEAIGAALAGSKVEQNAGSWVERAAWARLAQVTPDPEVVALLSAAVSADAHQNAAAPWLDAGEGLAHGRGADMLGAAIASQVAAAGAGTAD